jgi:hypothetical protein
MAERDAMIIVRENCAHPPLTDGKPDFAKALANVLAAYQQIQDLTKTGAP